MDSIKKLSEAQIAELKEAIDNELEVRGFKVETALKYEANQRGEETLKLTSTEFQTTPVLHKHLSINSFSGGKLTQDEEKEYIMNIWVPVHCSYEGNGVSLFDVHAVVRKGYNKRIFVRSIQTARN